MLNRGSRFPPRHGFSPADCRARKFAALAAATILLLIHPAHAQPITFRDITSQAGIRFIHNNAAFGKKYLPETLGPGCAFIDYDNDGYPDILLINGEDWPGHAKMGPTTLKLYHNNQDGTFTDVTRKAGLAVPMFGLGVAIGDYDNDGHEDIFITTLGQSHLFHNNGRGTFSDMTKAAGLWGPQEFSTSAAWVDYDRDGKLDLVVANYVEWSIQGDLFCTLDGTRKSYCTPESYRGSSARLWHNLGNGKFEDATQKAGFWDPTSKSLGIAILDYNGDGWPDILLANDTQPNKLYLNKQNGTFEERAVSAGIAFSEDGVARAGMGVDAGDYDRSGHPSIIITNFANQMLSLYHNEGNGLFVDEAPRSEVGRATLVTLGFGCFFFDYDNDGWPDIFVADGHIENEIERVQKRVSYAEPPHLFRNLGGGKFQEVTEQMGTGFAAPKVARAAAYADIDNDGALDLLVTTNGGRAYLFHNQAGTNHSLRIKLVGTKSNHDGIGSVVRVASGGDKQWQMLKSGSSYLSQSELVLTFGLGGKIKADSAEIQWPSGQVDKLSDVPSGQTLTIQEGRGVISSRAYRPRKPAPKTTAAARRMP
ncbi:MAG: CRTAC1 family protein [Acidobacteria bacterium]|nr:MAG: CRTAC1 family protein [Acidobacteriota bacterium]PYY09573.1 MAG: CRTAC1 family protein [Acidobacteriota bacterium]